MEIWKDIDGYEGHQVSSLGRVRTHNKISHNKRYSKRLWKDRIMKPKISKRDKCLRVELWANGSHKTFLIHRLMAVAFLGKPETEDMTVNHKDGNRLNNTIDNLEWLTRADNIRHGFANGLYHTLKPCKLIDENNREFVFKSLQDASKFLKRSTGYVSNRRRRGLNVISADGNAFNIVLGGDLMGL